MLSHMTTTTNVHVIILLLKYLIFKIDHTRWIRIFSDLKLAIDLNVFGSKNRISFSLTVFGDTESKNLWFGSSRNFQVKDLVLMLDENNPKS